LIEEPELEKRLGETYPDYKKRPPPPDPEIFISHPKSRGLSFHAVYDSRDAKLTHIK
jgi:hypothetical protein